MSFESTKLRMTAASWDRTIAWARHLRLNQTTPEAELWQHLRGRKLAGVKFRRQHPLGPYVLDFYAPQFRLAIEVDGPLHLGRAAEDAARQRLVEREGIQVLRIAASELEANAAACLRRIEEALAQRW